MSKVQEILEFLEGTLQTTSTKGKKKRMEGKAAKRLAVDPPGEQIAEPLFIPRDVVSYKSGEGRSNRGGKAAKRMAVDPPGEQQSRRLHRDVVTYRVEEGRSNRGGKAAKRMAVDPPGEQQSRRLHRDVVSYRVGEG